MDERTYGMNIYCGGAMSQSQIDQGTADVVPVSEIRYPHATIRIAEVTWRGNSGGSLFAALPIEYDGSPYSKQLPERHSGKGNVLWIDGHVSAMTLAQYNMMDAQANRNIWLRLTGPKPAVPAN